MSMAKKASVLILLAIPLAYLSGCVVSPYPASRVSVGGSVVNGELNSFYFAVGEYYRVPERDVYYLHDRHIPDHDIPVVFFISQHARVTPEVIVNLRLSGLSWMDISLRFGLGSEAYYVPVQKVYGPPYGNAYGYYQNRSRSEWNKIRLADDDVVNLVNLRFISERYNQPPEDVMRMRSSGRGFVNINDDIRRGRSGGEYRQQTPSGTREREVREPVMQQGGQGREMRQEDRRDVREPVRQQGEPEKVLRQQQERQDSREAEKQQGKKKLRGEDDTPAGQKDKKGKGGGRDGDDR